MAPRRVTVAYEPARPAHAANRYVGDVRRAIAKMGGDQEKAVEQEDYVRRMHAGGVPPAVTAAMILGHPHMHGVVGVAAECPRAEVLPARLPEAAPTVRVAIEVHGGQAKLEAHDSAFTTTVKDPSKFEVARARAAEIGHLDTDRQLHRFLAPDLEREDQEVFVVVGLDIHNDLRVYSEIARGQRDRVQVAPADVLRPVLIDGCVAYAVAHNHPSGSATPSAADKQLTKQLQAATEPYKPGLVFLDHLVIGSGGTYYSFADGKVKRG